MQVRGSLKFFPKKNWQIKNLIIFAALFIDHQMKFQYIKICSLCKNEEIKNLKNLELCFSHEKN